MIEKKNFFDKMHLSGREIQELIIAWLLLSVVFLAFRLKPPSEDQMLVFILTFISLIFVFGAAFIFHELAHKYAAISLGGKAEFRLDSRGMMITVVSMIIGFGILVPGAVFWSSDYARYSNIRGRISAAGPLTNMVLAAMFLTLLPLSNLLGLSIVQITGSIEVIWILKTVIGTGFSLNLLLGMFNLLPVWILDGKKIFDASTILWITIAIGFLGMYMFSYSIFNFRLGIGFGFIQL